MTTDVTVRRAFERAMAEATRRARDELGYPPTGYMEMVHRHGSHLAAARALLDVVPETEHKGIVELLWRGRPELTCEHHALDERFAVLFSDVQRRCARERLEWVERRLGQNDPRYRVTCPRASAADLRGARGVEPRCRRARRCCAPPCTPPVPRRASF